MEELERIASRIGRVACSPEHSDEALLESAGLVSELAVEFEAVQQRTLRAGDVPVDAASSESPDDGAITPEELDRVVREILSSEPR